MAEPNATAALAEYAAAAIRRKLPPEVVERAKVHLLDTLAAMVSGTLLPAGEAALRFVEGQGGTRESSVVGSRLRTSAANAALANGMSAHADETDDSHPASLTHPGCAVVPAALAMAERHGRGGRALLRAIVLGYDVCARIMLALDYEKFIERARSSHATGGIFGAAVASGALAGLNASVMRYVLTYAVQQASGTNIWFDDRDHIEKAFDFGGMPARNGVFAATMVESGMTAAPDAFFGRNNFFEAFGPDADRDAISRELGVNFEILQSNIKRWSVGSPNQSILDALEAIMRTEPIPVAMVTSVEVQMPAGSVDVVDNRDLPGVCAQYLIAVMLLDGTVSFAAAHDRDRMDDPAVRSIWKRVRLVSNVELQQARPRRQAIVTVELGDGRRLTHHAVAVRGTADNPMDRFEIERKASDLMQPVLGKRRTGELISAIWAAEKIDDVRELRPLFQVGRR